MNVPYAAQSERTTERDPTREVIRVRIDPQYHEIVVTPEMIYRDAQRQGIPVEEAMRIGMVELLRDQAVTAYYTVFRAGLTALAGKPVSDKDVESAMDVALEETHKRLREAEAEGKKWQELASRRGIEINALERAIARRE